MSALGGRFVVNDATETPDTVEAMLEYPNVLVSFSLSPTPPPGFEHMGGIGCVFEGTEGTLVDQLRGARSVGEGKKVENSPARRDDSGLAWAHARVPRRHQGANLETTCNVRYGTASRSPGCCPTSRIGPDAGCSGTTRRSGSLEITRPIKFSRATSGSPGNSERRAANIGRSRFSSGSGAR